MSDPKPSPTAPPIRAESFPRLSDRGQHYPHPNPEQSSSALFYEPPSILLPSQPSPYITSTASFPSSPGLPETVSTFPVAPAITPSSDLHHHPHHYHHQQPLPPLPPPRQQQQQQQSTSTSWPSSSDWKPSAAAAKMTMTRPSSDHLQNQVNSQSSAWSVSSGFPSRPWSSSSSSTTASSNSVASASSSLSGLTLELSNASVTESPSLENGVFKPVPQPGVSAPKKTNSHTKPTPEGHVPRPRNSFMLYRMDVVNRGLIKEETKHQNISKIVGLMWKGLSDTQQAPYRLAAQKEKDEHNRLYPDYIYQPAGAKKKPSRLHQGSKASKKAASLLENSSKKLKIDKGRAVEEKKDIERYLQVMEGYDSPDDEYSTKRPRSSRDCPSSPIRPSDSSHHHYASFAHQPEHPQPYALSDVRRSYNSQNDLGRDRPGRDHGIAIGFEPQSLEPSQSQHQPQQQYPNTHDSHPSHHLTSPSSQPPPPPPPPHQLYAYMPYDAYAMPQLPTAHDNPPIHPHYPNRDHSHRPQSANYHDFDQSNPRYCQPHQPAYRSIQTWYPSSTYPNSSDHHSLVDAHTPIDSRLENLRHQTGPSNRSGANQQFLPTSDPSPITPGFSSSLLEVGDGKGKKSLTGWKSLPGVGMAESERDGNNSLGFSRGLNPRVNYGRNPGTLSAQGSGSGPTSASRPSFLMGPHGETETPRTKTFINSIIARSPVEVENLTKNEPPMVEDLSESHSTGEAEDHDAERERQSLSSALNQSRQLFASVPLVPPFNKVDRPAISSSVIPSSTSGPSDAAFDGKNEKNWHINEQELFVAQRPAGEMISSSVPPYNHTRPAGPRPLHYSPNDQALSPSVTPNPNTYPDHRPASHGAESPFGRGSLNLESRKKGRPTSLQLGSSTGHRPSRPSSEFFYGPPPPSEEIPQVGQQSTYQSFGSHHDGSIEVPAGSRPARTRELRSGETTPTQNSYEGTMAVGTGPYEMDQPWMF